MTQVLFRSQPNGDPLEFGPEEVEAVQRASEAARRWAENNGFATLTLWLEEGSDRKLVVQFDDHPPLASWVDAAVFREGRAEDIEGSLDFARGEYRRRAAGFDRYDR